MICAMDEAMRTDKGQLHQSYEFLDRTGFREYCGLRFKSLCGTQRRHQRLKWIGPRRGKAVPHNPVESGRMIVEGTVHQLSFIWSRNGDSGLDKGV